MNLQTQVSQRFDFAPKEVVRLTGKLRNQVTYVLHLMVSGWPAVESGRYMTIFVFVANRIFPLFAVACEHVRSIKSMKLRS